jgi:uncharacterized repeat protein (TIGR01451 family)
MNTGAASTSGTVTAAVTLSSGMTASAISGHNWTCTLGTLICTRNDALDGAGGNYDPITVTVDVSSNATSSQTCAATVSGGGEIDAGNDSATDYITLPPVPDLVVSVSHFGKWYQGRVGGVYTIRVVNIGSGKTSGTVYLTDTLTSGLSLQTVTITGSWSCSVTTSLSCTNNAVLAAGAAYSPLTVTVNVSGTATSPQTNHAQVSGGGELLGHPYDQNNDGWDYTTIGTGTSGPDMTVVSQHFATFMRNQTAQYVIIATNSGNSATNGTVTVTDTLPAALTVSSVASAPGWSCTAASGSHTMTCTRSDVLPVGLSYRAIVLTVNVLGSAPSLVTNTVTVSGGGEVTTGNDTSNDATAVGG